MGVKFATPKGHERWRQLMEERKQMTVHELFDAVLRRAWLTEDKENFYRVALTGALTISPARAVEVFEEVLGKTAIPSRERAFYRWHFGRALEQQEVAA